MNRVLPILLAVLLLGSAGFGLSQINEINKLKLNLAALDQERADLQKKIWDLQKRNGELENRLVRSPGGTAAAGEPAGDVLAGGDPFGGPRGRGGFDGGRFAAMMANPEIQKLLAVQQRGALDGRYSSLFKQLQLSPADLDKFKNLLVEKQAAVMDVMAAARAQGLAGPDNRDQVRQLVQNAQAEVDTTIHASLGDAAYAQYQSYEATLPERNTVSQLEQRLSYSSTPLTDTQSAQLVQLLAQNAPAGNPGNGGGGLGALLGRGGLGGGTPITNEVVTQAQNILQPDQLAALQELQKEADAAAKARQQIRAGLSGQTPGATTQAPAVTPPVPGS